ncbi:MAG: hypothetical protein OH318_03010 [Candidatus Parvarchaeota archaeon]|nr:hypothetical protein [Candidatus Rehaiarchaeum fermentans]
MVGFDESLDGRNEAIKNKHKKENKVKIPGFSIGPTLEEILNEFKKKGINPTFGEIITELGNKSPQDFHIGGEDVLKAYPLGEVKVDDGKIIAYLQDLKGTGLLSIGIFYIYDDGNFSELGLYGRTNKSSLNSRDPLWAEYWTMTAPPNNPESYPKGSLIPRMLCVAHYTLKEMGLEGIGNVRFDKGDFDIRKTGEDPYPGKINIAGFWKGMVEGYKNAIDDNESICEDIFKSQA